MNLDLYAIRIDELKTLQNAINTRIKDLEDKAGYGDDFNKNVASAKERFLKLIADRVEVNDEESLYDILRVLHELFSEVFTAIQNGWSDEDKDEGVSNDEL